jgi:hypothetical protein
LEIIIKETMKSKTLEDIVNTPQLIDGTEVTGRFGEGETFIGKIVGQSSIGLVPNYIVECLDGTFPNETYNYKFLNLPLSEIFIR